jgi:hypothetical protein
LLCVVGVWWGLDGIVCMCGGVGGGGVVA